MSDLAPAIDDEMIFDFFGFDFQYQDYTDYTAESSEGSSVPDINDDIFSDDFEEQSLSPSTTTARNETPDNTSVSTPPPNTTENNNLTRGNEMKTSQSDLSLYQESQSSLTAASMPTTQTTSAPPASTAKPASSRPLKKKKKTEKKKPAAPSVLYRASISLTDTRRSYSKILLNAFNSCDERRLGEIIDRYCVESIVGIHRYEGVQNPYGSRNITTVKGRALIMDMWRTLFKSAPDFFFQTLDTQCFVDELSRMVIASKFKWSGTRVMNINIAEATNEAVLRRKLANKNRFDASELELLQEIGVNTVTEEESGLFFGAGDITLEASEDPNASLTFKLDTPLAQRLEMRCQGSFIVYLNEVNRIYQYEFVYISMDEIEAAAGASK